MYREVIINSRWGYACAAALIVLIIVTVAGAFAVRPIEAGQESTIEELEVGETEGGDSHGSRIDRSEGGGLMATLERELAARSPRTTAGAAAIVLRLHTTGRWVAICSSCCSTGSRSTGP